jgi:putative tryptophan/tyrosine transport system substrate-binding protein
MKLEQLQRRTFMTLLGAAGAAGVLSRPGYGQQTGRPLVGLLSSGRTDQAIIAAFKQGLSETGLVDGIGLDIEYRWADDQYDRLPALANELVARKVWVIAAIGLVSALAAKPAVTKLPLVFVISGDPIKFGLVNNLAQPGDKATGVTFSGSEITTTQFSLLGQLVPNPPAVGLLINPNDPSNPQDLEGAQNAHPTKLIVVKASQESELETAFASLAAQGAGALVVPRDSFFIDQRQKLVALAAQHKLPAIYPAREFAAAGGLMSYGASVAEASRQAGIYAGWLLKGTPPVQMPFQQNTQTEFVINLDTAQALGFTVPVALLGRADSVIQTR